MRQQESKNFREPDEVGGKLLSLHREFERLIARYPEKMTQEQVQSFEYDLRRFMIKGLYRSEDGRDEIEVVGVGVLAQQRPVDAYVEYRRVRGSLPDGRLPIVFFLEMHRFVRIDMASM